MKKNFREWSNVKQCIHEKDHRVFFHEGEIWWSSLGVNVGFEEDGKNEGFERPLFIFKKFNQEVFWGLPITSKQKSGLYYFNYEHNGKQYSIILSQLRLLDAKRLRRKMRSLPKGECAELERKFLALLS